MKHSKQGNSSVKNAVKGNCSLGIVLILFGFLYSFADLDGFDSLALVTGITFIAAFFISLMSVIQNRVLYDEYKNNLIYKALRIIRFVAIMLNIFIPWADLFTGMIFILTGLTFLLEAAYRSYFIGKGVWSCSNDSQ